MPETKEAWEEDARNASEDLLKAAENFHAVKTEGLEKGFCVEPAPDAPKPDDVPIGFPSEGVVAPRRSPEETEQKIAEAKKAVRTENGITKVLNLVASALGSL